MFSKFIEYCRNRKLRRAAELEEELWNHCQAHLIRVHSKSNTGKSSYEYESDDSNKIHSGKGNNGTWRITIEKVD